MKLFKKIKDERLLIAQLKNIRTVFYFQQVGIVLLLLYYGWKHGLSHVRDNPLWIVWILSASLLAFLQMNISADMEASRAKKKTTGAYVEKIIISFAIGLIFLLITALSGGEIQNGIIIGVVIFLCLFIPNTYIYILRKKRSDQEEDDQ